MSIERKWKVIAGVAAVATGGVFSGQHERLGLVIAAFDPKPKAPVAANGQPTYLNEGELKAVLLDGGGPEPTVTATASATATAFVPAKATETATAVPTRVTSERASVSCEGAAIAVPGKHSDIQPGSLNSSAPIGRWFNPIYNQAEANAEHNWRGIGPWAPIAFRNIDPNAAELKTFGNLGHFVIPGIKGGKVAIGLWQEAQHQDETKMKPDGTLNRSQKNQYTFLGLGANAPVGLFDPDTGKDLNTWPDGSPINYTANELGTFSIELPSGEVRVGVCINVPGQLTGVQVPEIQVFRGPNDHPELKGENPLPGDVIKPGMSD